MGLYIQKLNLPKGCGDCLFNREYADEYGHYWCIVDPCLLVDGFECIRHEKCPLKEIEIGIDLTTNDIRMDRKENSKNE